MKLILANNQTEKFRTFYAGLQQQSREPFDYSGYSSLLFLFGLDGDGSLSVQNLATGKALHDYDGVYINGYLSTYELAAAVAISCDALNVGYSNRELHDAPSLSKLTGYAKLVAAGVPIPPTLAGTKESLMQAQPYHPSDLFPAVLKRADADRGIDNFKVSNAAEVDEILYNYDEHSLWILQKFIPNDGFYLVNFYAQTPKFCIYRTLEERPDGDKRKAHMYKPQGGANASLIDITEVPPLVIETCQRAITAMNRQIGSVDCLVDSHSGRVYVLEVNYNPQLVTITTFKETRVRAFLENLENEW